MSILDNHLQNKLLVSLVTALKPPGGSREIRVIPRHIAGDLLCLGHASHPYCSHQYLEKFEMPLEYQHGPMLILFLPF